jgi:hypothetical protein
LYCEYVQKEAVLKGKYWDFWVLTGRLQPAKMPLRIPFSHPILQKEILAKKCGIPQKTGFMCINA